MDDESPISVGELSRRFAEVLVRVDGLIRDLDDKYLTEKLYLAHKKASDEKIARLESNLTWLVRTVIGLVISAVIAGLVLQSGGEL